MRRRSLQIVTLVAALWCGNIAARDQAVSSAVSASTQILWAPPQGERDLFNGPWGAALAPDPSATYTVVRRKRHGANPGVVVQDTTGRTWHVKQARTRLGDEGPVEVVLSRVLSAVGYPQPPVYYLRSFTIGDSSSTRTVPGGRFRLELPSLRERDPWPWEGNQFVGTRPYNGLLVILLVFNSWDLKDSNNSLYDVDQGGRVNTWFVVRDLGGALGETGTLVVKRNDIDRFERSGFIRGIGTDGFVDFAYRGKRANLFRRITGDDVRWATGLLSALGDQGWHDAFRAGGYPDEIAERFIRTIRARIDQGQQLAASGAQAPDGR